MTDADVQRLIDQYMQSGGMKQTLEKYNELLIEGLKQLGSNKFQINDDTAAGVARQFAEHLSRSLNDTLSSLTGSSSAGLGDIGVSFGRMLGGALGGMAGPIGMMIGKEIGGVAADILQNSIEGTRMLGAQAAPAVAAGREGLTTDFAGTGTKYLNTLTEIREKTGMTVQETDKLLRGYAQLGVGVLQPEAFRMAKQTKAYDDLLQLPSGTTRNTQEQLILTFGKSGMEVKTVMEQAYLSMQRLNSEFVKNRNETAGALGTGGAMAQILATITAQARTTSASLVGVQDIMMSLVESSAGYGGSASLGRPGQIVSGAGNLVGKLEDAMRPKTLSEAPAQGAMAMEVFNKTGMGRDLIERAKQEYEKVTGGKVGQKGSESYDNFTRMYFMPMIDMLKADRKQGDDVTRMSQLAMAFGMERYATENTTGVDPAAAIQMLGRVPGMPSLDTSDYLRLRRLRETFGLTGGTDDIDKIRRGLKDAPPEQRQELMDIMGKLETRADAGMSTMDKISNQFNYVSGFLREYWDNWQSGLTKVFFKPETFTPEQANITPAQRAQLRRNRMMEKGINPQDVDPTTMMSAPGGANLMSEEPAPMGESMEMSPMSFEAADTTEANSMVMTRAPIHTPEMSSAIRMDEQRHVGANDGR